MIHTAPSPALRRRRPGYTLLAGAAIAAAAWLSPRIAGAAAPSCWETGHDSSSTVQRNDAGELRLRVSNDRCTAELEARGDIRFTEDFTGVAHIAPGGGVRVREAEAGEERTLELRPTRNGGVVHVYEVNGRQRPFDDAARAWFAETLVVLFRRTGFAAEERAEWLLRRSGVDGVFAEVNEMTSSRPIRLYLARVLELHQDDATALRVLETAARRVSSSSQLADLLLAVAERQRLEGPLANAFFDALEEVSSSSARGKALLAIATDGSSGVLIRVARATGSIGSSSTQRAVLERVIETGGADERVLLAVLRSAQAISSSSARASVLAAAGEAALRSPPVQEAYLGALTGISSSSAKRKALQHLVSKEDVYPEELALALVAGRSIGSSSQLAELLVAIARRHPLDGALREAFLTSAREVGSRSHRERVLAALERHGSI